MNELDRAIRLLRAGGPILLHDAEGREDEVDLFFAAEHATPTAVRTLRQQAGGLVFLAVDPNVGHALGLPFLQDLYAHASQTHPVLGHLIPNDIKYDARSSFSLTINHRNTFTGITDEDRSLTITEFAKLARVCVGHRDVRPRVSDAAPSPSAPDMEAFGRAFRAPGHVHLCVGADRLLAQRQGHTELAVALARVADLAPVLVGAEMLSDDGKRRSKASALDWARENGTVLLEGRDVEAAWMNLEAGLPASP